MDLQQFIDNAGGVYTSSKDYGNINKYEHYWAFFFDQDFGWVRSVYGGIPVEDLYNETHSIEHVIPQSVLRDRLQGQGRPSNVVKGSKTNPLNFMPAHRVLNSRRGSAEFDSEDDAIVTSRPIPLSPEAHLITGMDLEKEWVIPVRTQGDIARCVLYMTLIYELHGLYEEDLEKMRQWALLDPPQPWEIAFNEWVKGKFSISNPLITNDASELEAILSSTALFSTTLIDVPPLPTPTQDPFPQGIKNGYAVLVGQIEGIIRDTDRTPHLLYRVHSNTASWKASINVRSSFSVSVDPQPGVPKNDLLVFIDENWQHPITDKLLAKDFEQGIHLIKREANALALDYIRGNLFNPAQMVIIPHSQTGENNDLFERLEAILFKARDQGATVYSFGEPFPDGRGIHNIHMNQGSIIEEFQETDGVWQDGGLLINFEGRWVAIFTAFQSQCWHTDDQTGQANPDLQCSRFTQGDDDQSGLDEGAMVRIVSALVNPAGVDKGKEQVTLINLGSETVDLDQWRLVDRARRTENLSGELEAGESKMIELSGTGVILSNAGSTLSLLNSGGLRVHGVSYTKDQVSRQTRIIFIN